MPAISDKLADDGLIAWMFIHGQTIRMISGADAGKFFQAALLVMPDATMQGEVVQDNREKSTIVFTNASYPSNAKPGDYLTDDSGNTWRLGKRTNNPTDSSVDFELIKKTPQDK
jgi:hypothetical protein